MTDWAELAGAAMLGTARRKVDPGALPGLLGEAAGHLRTADPAEALLDAAALAAPYRRAGEKPVAAADQPVEPAAPETLRQVSPAAAARLNHLLTERQTASTRSLLLEWLAAASDAARHVPHETIPVLLDASARERAFGAAAVGVIGARGRWLARFRPEWQRVFTTHAASAAPVSVDLSAWEVGEEATRRGLLAELRRTDPSAARELLETSWEREKGEDREAFTEALQIGLSPADETLLEAALDDRRKGVRERAAGLLQRLPDSAYARRMAERAGTLLRVERRMLRSRLVITPPAEADAAMLRDGLTAKPAQGTGEQAWIAYQIIAATPLAVWSALSGLQPQQLLGLSAESDWHDALFAGWMAATRLQRDAGWAQALLDAAVDQPPVAELVGLLEPARRTAVVAQAVRAASTRQVPELLALLEACPSPWPDALADEVLAAVAKRSSQPLDPTIRELLRIAAHRISPTRAGEATTLASRLSGDLPSRAALLAFADTLTFRRDMIEELR
jgi:hypothetical protein